MNPWRDVDLRKESQRVGRECGYIAPDEYFCSGDDFPLFEDYRELIIPRSEWRDVYDSAMSVGGDQAWLATVTHDQNGFGTCTSHACAQAMAYQWTRQFGKNWTIKPAPTSIYPFCASSGNSGSSVSCIVRRATEYGVLLEDTSQNKTVLNTLGLDPTHVIDGVQWNAGKRCPQSWYDSTARHFKIKEAYSLSSSEQMFMAVLQGFTIVYGRSGHAICGCWLEPEGTSWILLYHNSWGPWGRTINGLRGYGEDSESYLNRTGAPRGAVAIRTITEPPGAENLRATA